MRYTLFSGVRGPSRLGLLDLLSEGIAGGLIIVIWQPHHCAPGTRVLRELVTPGKSCAKRERMNAVIRHKTRCIVNLAGLLVMLGWTESCLSSPDALIVSPDGAVHFRLLQGKDRLKFTVSSRTNLIIEPSAMKFTVDGVDLAEGVEVGPPDRYRVNETYP